jgi:hypothetical protein
VCLPVLASAIDGVSRRNAQPPVVLEVLSVFLKEVDSPNFIHLTEFCLSASPNVTHTIKMIASGAEIQ